MRERVARVLGQWLPRGERIDDEAFAERHRILTWFLIAHLPLLLAFGLWRGQGLTHVLLELVTPVVLAALALTPTLARRWRSLATTAALVFVSVVIVHFSGGTIEAHFHFFIILGFVALYQDWTPFAWAIGFTLVSHGVMGTIDPATMYNHEAALSAPWRWAMIHAGAVAVAAVGQLLHWRFSETERRRSAELSASLLDERTAHRASLAGLYVTLARRSQGLLDRQLEAIDGLEALEEDPDRLERLFRIDHLATRLRRHTESLLVLADERTPRSWSDPAPLRDVARAAAAEVEEYQRVDVEIPDGILVDGSAVSDLAHLLAELLENALRFSGPTTRVLLGAHRTPEGRVLAVEDSGLGMSRERLEEVNRRLGEIGDLTPVGPQMGLRVVAHLAARHDIRVRLVAPRSGGTAALVLVPAELIRVGPQEVGPQEVGWQEQAPARGAPAPAAPSPPATGPAATGPADAAPVAPEPPTGTPAPPSPSLHGSSPTGPAASGSGSEGLPQRTPRDPGSWSHGVRPVHGAFETGGREHPPTGREARSRRLSAFQAGTVAGREVATGTETATGRAREPSTETSTETRADQAPAPGGAPRADDGPHHDGRETP